VLGVFRQFAVDAVDLDQGKITFAFFRGPDFALYAVPGMQIESSDLGGRYIDVIRAGQIRSVGRAQESEAVLQYFQRSVAEDAVTFFCLVLEQRKDEILFAHTAGIFDFVGNRHFNQFGHGKVL